MKLRGQQRSAHLLGNLRRLTPLPKLLREGDAAQPAASKDGSPWAAPGSCFNSARRSQLRRAWLLQLSLAAGLSSATAAASSPSHLPQPSSERDDGGVYGRFDGDLAWELEAGAAYRTSTDATQLKLGASLRYFQILELHGGYQRSLKELDASMDTVLAELRIEPLFLLRFAGNHEWGRALPDLLLDSCYLGLGSAVFLAGGPSPTEVHLRLSAGFGLPLLARAPGPWLRVWGALHPDADQLAPEFGLSLAWQGFLESPWLAP